ncbi:GTPase ObgE [Candidatus Wolfebacteria bacterium]|nr:MAG: GTPase ObgE [Candidatus Wolfebacteria bacterium]
MAFVDEITIYARAGKGGDGVVRWRREKYIDKGGPNGGDGGRGGDFYIRAVRDINIFSKYRNQKDFSAENGESGGKSSLEGKNGEDYFFDVPVGSIITNNTTDKQYTLLKEGEQILILHGGKGGFGNEHFKSPINTTPMESTPGKPGEEAEIYVELQLIADIGLIGFPNAGKSSLLNSITAAEAKIGSYPFTTLEPNLGVLAGGYIVADIPGVIEGASEGKGLGSKFLRHIRRTKFLVHLVSLENPDPIEAYTTIRHELEKFDEELAKRKEIIILSKSDVAHMDQIERVKESFKKINKEVMVLTLFDDVSIKQVTDGIVKILRNINI